LRAKHFLQIANGEVVVLVWLKVVALAQQGDALKIS